jgi:membrane associated rhomboid family serine protease
VRHQFERFSREAKQKLAGPRPSSGAADGSKKASQRKRSELALASAEPFNVSMFGVAKSDDYQPVAWLGRYPVHLPGLLVIAHVACMVFACLLYLVGQETVLGLFVFDSSQVLYAGRVWQIATYAFVHQPGNMNLIWFAIEMYMLFVFGREVERFIGRRAFFALYALLLFIPALLLTLCGLWFRTGLVGSTGIHFGIFIAFAAIYPNAEIFFRITAKWIALILVGISSLQSLAYHGWSELVVLWLSVGVACAFVQCRGAGLQLEWLSGWTSRWRSRRALRVVPPAPPRRTVEPDDIYDSIDPVLDKISRSGIGSLTASERRALDRARNRLLNKSK